jgi:hypothetical protein
LIRLRHDLLPSPGPRIFGPAEHLLDVTCEQALPVGIGTQDGGQRRIHGEREQDGLDASAVEDLGPLRLCGGGVQVVVHDGLAVHVHAPVDEDPPLGVPLVDQVAPCLEVEDGSGKLLLLDEAGAGDRQLGGAGLHAELHARLARGVGGGAEEQHAVLGLLALSLRAASEES